MALAALVARSDIEVHLVFALRSDGLHHLDTLRAYLPTLLDTTLELRHLDENDVREAITRPIDVWNTQKEFAPKKLDSDFPDTLIAELRPQG